MRPAADNILDWMKLCILDGCKFEVAANVVGQMVLVYKPKPSDPLDFKATWWADDWDGLWAMVGEHPEGMID
jgi:hypothetical protein